MLIRCETCQAVFSLQDGVIRGAKGEVPQSFAVECGRCLATFEAAAPASLLPPGKRKTPAPPASAKPNATPKPSAAAERLQEAPTSATLARALKPKRPEGEDDEFTREMKRVAARNKLLGRIALAAVVIAALIGGGLFLKRKLSSLPAEASAKLEQAHKKLLRDDFASLDAAVQLATEAGKLAPSEPALEGERAFALLLSAAAHTDLADRSQARADQLNDQIARLQMAHPDGWEKQVDAIRGQLQQIAEERDPHVRAATQQLNAGRTAARTALDEDEEEPSALRATALYAALTNTVQSGLGYADRADAAAPGDLWNAYVRAQLTLAGSPSREKGEKGRELLETIRKGNPAMLRALYDEAAIDASEQNVIAALEKLNQLLAENPQHERAQHLKTVLAAPPPAPIPPAGAPGAEPASPAPAPGAPAR